jgi:RNA polymerase sigma-70 factor (ECF subfamily)
MGELGPGADEGSRVSGQAADLGVDAFAVRATAARDTAWGARVQRGDVTVFEEMYAEYGARLCAYVHRWTQSRAVAEELVQDLFLSIWVRRDEWSINDSMTAYLFRAARNRTLNYLRHRRIEQQYAESPEGVAPAPVAGTSHFLQADETLAREERRLAVQRAIALLPERTREVFLLNREQGATYGDIAAMLGISIKTVEYHMGRAFVQLRRRLADWSPDARDHD